MAGLRARHRPGRPQPARKALDSLRRRSLDIHVLMLLAVAGALAIGEWAEQEIVNAKQLSRILRNYLISFAIIGLVLLAIHFVNKWADEKVNTPAAPSRMPTPAPEVKRA